MTQLTVNENFNKNHN